MDLIKHKIEVLQLKIRYTKNILSNLNVLHKVLMAQRGNQIIFIKYAKKIDGLSLVDQQIMNTVDRVRRSEENLSGLQLELEKLKKKSSADYQE